MKKYMSILKPDVRKAVLETEKDVDFTRMKKTEKIEYLNIPDNVNLSADMKRGAEQFAPLNTLLEKEKEPKYILLTVDNLEQGYLAVSYLQAEFSKKNFGCYEERNEDKSILDTWMETPMQVPIIKERELQLTMNGPQNNFYAMDIFSAQSNARIENGNPYWMNCTNEAVCIVAENSMFYFGGGDSNYLLEGLEHFRHNKKIYVINNEQFSRYHMEFEDEGEDGEKERERQGWNSLVLSYAMDEAELKFTKEQMKKYFKGILKGVAAQKGLKFKKGFSYEKLVNIFIKMKEEKKCLLIENVMNYAVKDRREDDKKELCNEDFKFIDRFFRIEDCSEVKKKKSARLRLQENLIGMDSVKEQVLNVINVMKYNKLRTSMNIYGGSYHNVHMMLGAPGTAKTTVAKLMGEIMVEEGLLRDDRFICVNGAELKGMYVGHSAPKTKALFEDNDIIVIDEAYSLVGDKGEQDSFSKEAIAQLIIELENHSMDKLVIFAGYGGQKVSEKNNKMKDFLNANPGIKSRITSTIYFDSYTPEEMTEIFYRIAELQKYKVEEIVKERLKLHFLSRVRDDNFGNGREARQLLETAVVFAATRVFAQNKKTYSRLEMQTITIEDIEKALHSMEQQFFAQDGQSVNRIIGFSARN